MRTFKPVKRTTAAEDFSDFAVDGESQAARELALSEEVAALSAEIAMYEARVDELNAEKRAMLNSIRALEAQLHLWRDRAEQMRAKAKELEQKQGENDTCL